MSKGERSRGMMERGAGRSNDLPWPAPRVRVLTDEDREMLKLRGSTVTLAEVEAAPVPVLPEVEAWRQGLERQPVSALLSIEDRLSRAERRIGELERRLGREGPWYPDAPRVQPAVTVTALGADGRGRHACRCIPGALCSGVECPKGREAVAAPYPGDATGLEYRGG